jgi:hypothetical protein
MKTKSILKQNPTLSKCYGYFFPLILVVVAILVTSASRYIGAHAAGNRTTTIYVQTLDSCQHAMGGASFQLTGNSLKLTAGPAPGSGVHVLIKEPTKLDNCPIQRGSCSLTSVGCVTFTIPVPESGMATYTITETVTAPKSVPCDGGSVCPGGPVTATVTIDSTGAVSARVRNVDPDGTVVFWPTTGTYAATLTDPIVVHDFMLGTGSCDGDHDEDDRLTGSPSNHCDSDHDRTKQAKNSHH